MIIERANEVPSAALRKAECMHAARVAFQVEGARHFAEVSSLVELDLPHLDIRCKACKALHVQSWHEQEAGILRSLPDAPMKRPHVETAANELPMLFVLMSLSSSPFKSQTLMVVSGYDVITKPLIEIPTFIISLSSF